ncbi:MAG: HPF/RaiA family ribosome-associated protein [Holosporaceae bacterium]
MQIQIKGKHVALGATFYTTIQDSIHALAAKYRLDKSHVSVVVALDAKGFFCIQCICDMGKGAFLRVHHSGTDAYKTAHKGFSLLEKEIRKAKKRIDDHHRHHDNHHFLTKEDLALRTASV